MAARRPTAGSLANGYMAASGGDRSHLDGLYRSQVKVKRLVLQVMDAMKIPHDARNVDGKVGVVGAPTFTPPDVGRGAMCCPNFHRQPRGISPSMTAGAPPTPTFVAYGKRAEAAPPLPLFGDGGNASPHPLGAYVAANPSGLYSHVGPNVYVNSAFNGLYGLGRYDFMCEASDHQQTNMYQLSTMSPESRQTGSSETADDMPLRRPLATDGIPKVTLKVRHIPQAYTQEMLLELWQNYGSYDILYLPLSYKSIRNLTYCFINFTSEEHAESFKAAWHGKRLPGYQNNAPRLTVTACHLQGFDELLDYITTFARRRKARTVTPYIILEGQQVSLDQFK